ncbi:hypothetical protein ACSYAD_05855 [Acaryochloris marina NIES-2412]|uniref:hypothetical protein n=1 Tax=Acaryochloris marina TaxID=155978 RepID=UPI004059CAEE
MSDHQLLSSKIHEGVKFAIAQALDRHRKLGESIAVWQDGKIVTLTADQIPAMDNIQDEEGQNEMQQSSDLA